jgi:hypothetical protein
MGFCFLKKSRKVQPSQKNAFFGPVWTKFFLDFFTTHTKKKKPFGGYDPGCLRYRGGKNYPNLLFYITSR